MCFYLHYLPDKNYTPLINKSACGILQESAYTKYGSCKDKYICIFSIFEDIGHIIFAPLQRLLYETTFPLPGGLLLFYVSHVQHFEIKVYSLAKIFLGLFGSKFGFF